MDRAKLYDRIDFMRMHNCNTLGDPAVVAKIAQRTRMLLEYLSEAYSTVPHLNAREISFFQRKLKDIADAPGDRAAVETACRLMCDKIHEPQNEMYSRMVFGRGGLGTLDRLDPASIQMIAKCL